MVAGWDEGQRKLALNMQDNLALDVLGEHEGMIPEWMGSDYPIAGNPSAEAQRQDEQNSMGTMSRVALNMVRRPSEFSTSDLPLFG